MANLGNPAAKLKLEAQQFSGNFVIRSRLITILYFHSNCEAFRSCVSEIGLVLL